MESGRHWVGEHCAPQDSNSMINATNIRYTEAEVVEMLEGVDFRHVGHITFEDFKV